MVTTQRLADEPKELKEEISIYESDHTDDFSETSSEGSDHQNGGLEICPSEETAGNFGNIVVKNSSEVHFGNKTFYQGPVTIKQFLYNNGSSETNLDIENGQVNPALVTDSAFDKKHIENSCNNNCDLNGGIKRISEEPIIQSGNL